MKRNTLIYRMAFWFVLVVILVIVVFGIVNITVFNKEKTDSLIKTYETVARNDGAGIEIIATQLDQLYKTLTDSNLTNSNKAYITYMLNPENDLILGLKNYYELSDMILRDCRITVGSILNSWNVNLFLSEEMPLYSQNFITQLGIKSLLDNYYFEGGAFRIVKDTLVREDEWYRKAIEAAGEPVWLEKDGFVLAARSLSTLNQGKNYSDIRYHDMGVLLVIFRTDSIKNILLPGKPTENSCIELYNAENAVLWKSQDHIPNKSLKIENIIRDGLKLIIHVPYKDMQKVTDNTLRTILLFLILSTGLGILLVLMVTGWITRPVRRLSNFMKEKKGELITEEMIPDQKDEIRNLYLSYNELIGSIHEEEAKRRKAEMDYLQLQINPHFLYNTLDTVCFMAMTDGNNKIADILSELAGIYRYNIKDFDNEVILVKELDILRDYIDIYQSRSSGKIECTIDTEEGLENAIVPKMILQPLVENAILYGSVHGSGNIWVRCKKEDDILRIQVLDEGTGADIRKINLYLEGKSELSVHSTGIGIRNVHQRIRMRYGAPYGLKYYNTEQGGTCAEIILPYQVHSTYNG